MSGILIETVGFCPEATAIAGRGSSMIVGERADAAAVAGREYSTYVLTCPLEAAEA